MMNKVNDKIMINDAKEIYKFNPLIRDSFINCHFHGLFDKNPFNYKYLGYRFDYLIKKSDAIILIAEESDTLGLIYGGPENYKEEMDKVIFKRHFLSLLYIKHLFKVLGSKIFRKISNKSKNHAITTYEAYEQYQMIIHECYRLTGIVVKSVFRSKGVGGMLLNLFENRVRDKNYSAIIVKTPTYNIRAIDFYKQNNYILVRKIDNSVELLKLLDGINS